ncbi:extracellular solute-binding protein [Actinoplanes sp. NPDC049668]|uniref:extracellular solute-binding protein n=1 Tax=unclassified Actinoplanes TaxID=2626549 RepID=UPI0033A7646E
MPFSTTASRRFLPHATAALVGVAAIAATLLYLPQAGKRTASGGPPASPAPSATPSADVPALPAGVRLNIIAGKDPSGVRQELIAEWNAEHPQAPAHLREIEGDTSRQRLEIRTALRDGSAAVAVLDSVHLSEFAARRDDGTDGLLAELGSDDALVDGFLKGPLATCYWKQRRYGLPFNTDVGLLFTAGGTPEPDSWTEMTDSARASANRRQIALQLGPNEAFVVNVLEQMLAEDKSILNSTGVENVVRRDDWEAAIEPLKKAYAEGLILDSGSEDAGTEALIDGRVRYLRNWPAQYKKIDRRPEVRRLFGPGVLGGQNLVVSRTTPYDEQALELLKFLTNSRSQERLFRVGGFAPTRRTTYGLQAVRDDVPYAAELLTAVEAARPRPITPHYDKVSGLILNNLRPAVLYGRRIDDSFELDMAEALHE